MTDDGGAAGSGGGSGTGDAGESADVDDVPDSETLAAEVARLRDRVDELTDETAPEAEAAAEADETIADLRSEFEDLERDVEDRTVHREEIERELKGYVRKRVRRGHARGWGPYLVLLYGTAMTLGVFYFFQNSAGYAILSMIIIWLSTLGLYTLMLLVNGAISLLSVPGRARDLLGALRSLKP